MTKEIATYIKEFEDYSDGYDDFPSEEDITIEEEQVGKAVSHLEKRTLEFSISEELTPKEAFGEDGRVYKRTAVISRVSWKANPKEWGMLEGAFVQLGYQKVGL